VKATADHVETPLGRLYVEVSGTGDPMLMWPSLLTDHTLFAAQVAHFRDRYTTVTVDPPGQGRSERLDRLFTFSECARCYVEILDALGFERAHLLGNSWGAMIGGTVAATYPDRVRCAVLMNGTGSAASPWPRLKDRAWILAVRRLGRVPMVERAIVPRFLGRTTRRHEPDLVRRLVEVIGGHEARSLTMAVESVVVRRPDQHELFRTIPTPVLVITGREDTSFPVREVRRMADAIPGAEFVVLPGAGHLVAYEAPAAVNKLVDDFLARHPDA
jgi:3-oxoadipate enol-lactonase